MSQQKEQQQQIADKMAKIKDKPFSPEIKAAINKKQQYINDGKQVNK